MSAWKGTNPLMAKGDRFAPEWSIHHDRKTGIEVKQLTKSLATEEK
jgi:hypothetical protein